MHAFDQTVLYEFYDFLLRFLWTDHTFSSSIFFGQ